jgi:hypothetical protein
MMSLHFTKYLPDSEKELHGIIENNLEGIEKGILLLEREKGLPNGIPDFLCVDSGKRIVIIEVKLHQDENILFQALRYYNDVDKNRYVLANVFKENRIDPSQHPRVILIAEDFSNDIKNMVTLVKPEVELFIYQALKINEDEGIVFIPIITPKLEESIIAESPSAESIYEYLQNKSLHIIMDEARKLIIAINKDIEEYYSYSYIGFKYKGRLVATIGAHRQSFDISYSNSDDKGSIEFSYQRITSATDDYSEAINKINDTVETLRKIRN